MTETVRGGALVSAFDENQPNLQIGTIHGQADVVRAASSDELWASLKEFLIEILPVCEKHGVSLSLHPVCLSSHFIEFAANKG